MRHVTRLLLPLFLLLLGGAPALAQNGDWTLSEVKGAVTVLDSRGEHAAAVGTRLAPGTTIRTAARASAVLVRGREFVTMRQNAQLRIPPALRERGIVQILQDYGSVLFNIGKQPNPHFGVETPYLAAVVKGTTFVITVSGEGASLQVTEGAVETATLDGGARELIRSGAAAMIAAADPLRMVVEGEGRRVVDSPARGAGGMAPAAPAVIEPAAFSTSGNQARIEQAILGTPRELGEISGGFVAGEVAALAAVVVADNTGRGAEAPIGNSRGRAGDGEVCVAGTCGSGGSGNGNGGGNGSGSGDGSGSGNSGNDGPRPGNGNGNGNGAGSGNGQGNSGGAGNGNGNGNGAGNGNAPGAGDGPGNGNGNGNGPGNGSGNGSNEGPGAGHGNGNGNGNGNYGGPPGDGQNDAPYEQGDDDYGRDDRDGPGNANGDDDANGNGNNNNGNGNGRGIGNGGDNGGRTEVRVRGGTGVLADPGLIAPEAGVYLRR